MKRSVQIKLIFLKKLRPILLILSAVFLSPFNVHAQEIPQNRTILALYDSTEGYSRREDDNRIHNNAEVILNYLGLKVRYHDINQGLPDDQKMHDVHGILSWFRDETIPNAEEYCRWAIGMLRSGKKLVIFKNPGLFIDKKTKKEISTELIDEFFTAMGLKYYGNWTDNTFVIDIVKKDNEMVEFERTLDGEIDVFEQIRSADQRNKEYLVLRRKDMPNSESAVVVTTPFGGFILENYGIFSSYIDNRSQWRVNPFRFFEEAFALEGLPRLDTTTLFGRRISYSHIDGDGFRNVFELDHNKYASEVILEEILKKYQFPVTVSYITAEIDKRYMGSDRLLAIAKQMARLNTVEVGSHGFTHPLHWEDGLTAFAVKGFSEKNQIKRSEEDILENVYPEAAKIIVSQDEYIQKEIRESIKFINENISPDDKPVKLFQWTGNCRPMSAAIAASDQAGVLNINGGDTRLDDMDKTYTNVAPLYRQINGEIQYFTSNANENIYTESWEKNYHAFQNVIKTFEQTEYPTLIDGVPRRITPVNIYYHFYIGEKETSLNSLKTVYDYVLKSKTIPIFTSRYISLVNGFRNARIFELPDGGWKIENYGDDRTIRFDREQGFVHFARSQGVIGFSRWEDYLYVHLEKGREARIYLTQTPPQEPYLEESSVLIEDFSIAKEQVSLTAQGFSEATLTFKNMLPQSSYGIQLTGADQTTLPNVKRFQSDENGDLVVSFPIIGQKQIIIEL